MARAVLMSAFALLLAYAQWEQLGPPMGSARVEVITEPRVPARVYVWRGNAEFRLTPVDASLPIRSDTYYRDRLWTASPDPRAMEVVAADQYHYILLQGSATFVLPPGKYRVEAYRGFFYEPGTAEFEVKAGESRRVTVPMKTWEGADRREWISADDHIHLTRSRKENAVYLGWLEAEDLTVANFLQLQRQMDAAVQYAFGKAGEAARNGYVIRPGHESRNEFWGHVNLLGGREMIRPLSTGTMYANTPESYPYPAVWFAAGRKVGATVGYAHFFQAPQRSTVYMDAALGNIDFVEVFQFGVLKTDIWYELLGAGLKVTGIAGSDFPVNLGNRRPWPKWLPLIGPERAMVKARVRAGESAYDAWARGVREGKVVVTNGPLVELSMDENTGRARATAAFWRSLEILEIVRNGEVIASAKGDGTVKRLSVEVDASLAESAWVAARVRARKLTGEPDIQAHTNPVYLPKDGKRVRVRAAREIVARKWEQDLTFFRGAGIVFGDSDKRREFFEAGDRALAELKK